MSKFIFVTGGVVSGLGKGITVSSIGLLLKSSGLKVFVQKFDPYLNIDPGTMSPYQHGEVYVTADGAETDLDLGHYERFIDADLTKNSNVTSGKIYQTILQKERQGMYNGKTVQVVPHVTNEIKQKLYDVAEETKADVIITEIGGTVGDIESLPFLEAARQLRQELGRNSVIFLHLSLVPYIEASNEYKTKPTQHSVQLLLSLGIQPDMIFARSDTNLDILILEKIALFCNVDKKNVIVASNVKSIYEVPIKFYQQETHLRVLELLNIKTVKTDITDWKKFLKKINQVNYRVKIAIVGKYVEMPDAYLSVIESLKIAGYENKTVVDIIWIKAQELTVKNYAQKLVNLDGIIVPGGFGERGFAGKILTAKYARENNIPFLGICFGLHAAIIEFARHVCNLPSASSLEFDDHMVTPLITILSGKTKTDDLGGTLRLGNYQTKIIPNTLAASLYQKLVVTERHRHRYEVNNDYLDILNKNGMIISGIYESKNLVEIIEIPNHSFFIATQYHPEFTSRPNKPNPLFNGLIVAAIKNKKQEK